MYSYCKPPDQKHGDWYIQPELFARENPRIAHKIKQKRTEKFKPCLLSRVPLAYTLTAQTNCVYTIFLRARSKKCVIYVPLLFSSRSFLYISLLYETKDF